MKADQDKSVVGGKTESSAEVVKNYQWNIMIQFAILCRLKHSSILKVCGKCFL